MGTLIDEVSPKTVQFCPDFKKVSTKTCSVKHMVCVSGNNTHFFFKTCLVNLEQQLTSPFDEM